VLRDAYGLELTTDSRAAADAYDQGARALLGFGADTVTSFEAAVAADPGFALGRAGLAVTRYLDEQIPEGRAEMERAVEAAKASPLTQRGWGGGGGATTPSLSSRTSSASTRAT
jgi:hypothetical protein